MAKGSPSSSEPAEASAPDRYVSFLDIDFEGNIAAVLDHLRRYIDNPETGNAFWDRFKERLQRCEDGEAVTADKLLLLHSHVYFMVELFEEHDDAEALSALRKLEEECFLDPRLFLTHPKAKFDNVPHP